jgi:hypothetical protein
MVMEKKNLWLGILVLVLGMTVMGCSTTAPVFYSNNSNKEFIILGEVTYIAGTVFGKDKQGFLDFFAEVKKKYPNADYVIDVMVDTREGRRLIFFKRFNYMYRGTAIQYVK